MPVCQQRLIPQQLLRGVSMGVGVPSISASLRPMQTEIPTVIQLTYDKKGPFHIRGPNWRSLLKLMAMMGSTRIEPSTETIANATKDIRLRVVVSFVKVHSTSPEWNTVLYMSMDRPVKSDTPNAQRYRNGDTTMLPWSYTLTAPPAVLRDGADAAMSKFYTVPNTPGNLYPTLPISMPDLATYLATALDVSRNGAHEGIPGLRRLSKLIDSIYPLDQIELDDEKRGMRQKLKSFVGLGSKPSRSRNDQTYDLVTPFVPDEFGR
ncbi:hypothetical protein WOLCODRAFT_99932 [Wolfiporia cocos MD-104 SS10]|uniref:Uncharacterized protein n=1 Tax=Wolfiporia cocos (strain MD-104) TaxID=742152 RepID=A0A2H3JYB9_WOLCO|nr:hypothetical protein WOLCODRAFT_99932 [Wolfiporia cocos MD-104 SS10]